MWFGQEQRQQADGVGTTNKRFRLSRDALRRKVGQDRIGKMDGACQASNDCATQKKTVHPYLSASLIVNIISLSYLFMPWAFSQGGWLLSIGSMVLVFVIGYLASINVAEACARAETWTRFLQERLRREEELDKQEEEEEEDIEAASQHHNKKRRNITINLDVFRCSDSGHTGATMDVIGHDLFNVAEDTSSCSVLSDEELLDNDDDDASPQNNKVRNEEDAFPNTTENSSASKIIRTTKSMDTADETIQDSMHDNSNTKIIASYYYCGYQQKDSFESDEQQFNSDGSNSSSNNSPLSVSDNDDDNNSDKSLPPRAILHVSTGGREAPRGVKEAVRQWDAPTIGERKFELTDLSRVFLGGHLSVFFTTTTALELFGGTWALGAIFGSSFATEVPIDSLGGPDQSYYLYVAVFAILATALSSMPSVVDQLSVQLCFLGMRMVMLVLMILTVVVAWSSGVPHFDDATPSSSSSSSWGVSGVPLVNWGRLHVILQISIWSTGYQFAVPAVASTARDKRRVPSIIRTAVLFILVTTLVLSLLLSFYFGPDNMQVSSNLNWSTYHGGTGYLESDDGGIPLCCRRRGVAWWARIIGTFIVLYPAVDGIGVFSLSAVSLSELVMGFWCKDALQDWKKRTLFRLLGSLPQLVCALFVKDLSVIANYTGLFTILSYFCCPSLLAIYSRRLLQDHNIPSNTQYHSFLSEPIYAKGVLTLASIIMVVVLILSTTTKK